MVGKLRFLFVILFSLSAGQGIWAQTTGLIYEYGKQISLDGMVASRIYPGPPNYESVRRGDEAEHIWLLKLSKPIELKDDGVPTTNNEAEKNIREVQLVITSPKNERFLEKSIGHSVKLSGSLFHALTGHHHLKVLMDVEKCIARK